MDGERKVLVLLQVPALSSGDSTDNRGFSILFPQGQHLTFPAVALWVTIALAICLLGLLGALAYVCRKKIRQSCKEEEENAGKQPKRGWWWR